MQDGNSTTGRGLKVEKVMGPIWIIEIRFRTTRFWLPRFATPSATQKIHKINTN